MLDRILRNALDGFTVIEDETGAVGKILARQMATYAKNVGKKVAYVNMESEDRNGSDGRGLQPLRPLVPSGEYGGSRESSGGPQLAGRAQKYVFLQGPGADTVILEGFSTFAFEKTDKEIAEFIRQISAQTKLKRSFILTYDKNLLSDKIDAYLRAMADSVIVVSTTVQSDRVTRMLYLPKMKDSKPIDRLIKVTVDQSGIQADTREFVG